MVEDINARVEELKDILKDCNLCGNSCGVDRCAGETGVCGLDDKLRLSSASPHFGEEPCLVGSNGSGTMFLTGCPMTCVYCQNWRISQENIGEEIDTEQMGEIMLDLQKSGCHNINWVTPTHYVPQLVESLCWAKNRGLEIPIVYNTGGYDNPEVIKLLDGIIDTYMPDVKYGDNSRAKRYSGVDNYWDIVRSNLSEMYNQVGDLDRDVKGIAKSGLLVRHLVLPGGMDDSKKILSYLRDNVSEESWVNVMGQYRPAWRSHDLSSLANSLKRNEYLEVRNFARDIGLRLIN